MSIRIIDHGDMFTSGAEALVIPTNCRGPMGAGVALAAATRWPATCEIYQRKCRLGLVAPGSLEVGRAAMGADSVWLAFVATKDHWRRPSEFQWVEDGLAALVTWALAERPGSLAIPGIGCGYGGLPWDIIQPRMLAELSRLPDTMAVMVYAPHEQPKARRSRVRR